MTTARELIEAKCCTASCIAATTQATRCSCSCRGELHGLLSDANVDSLMDARHSGLHRLTDLEIVDAA